MSEVFYSIKGRYFFIFVNGKEVPLGIPYSGQNTNTTVSGTAGKDGKDAIVAFGSFERKDLFGITSDITFKIPLQNHQSNPVYLDLTQDGYIQCKKDGMYEFNYSIIVNLTDPGLAIETALSKVANINDPSNAISGSNCYQQFSNADSITQFNGSCIVYLKSGELLFPIVKRSLTVVVNKPFIIPDSSSILNQGTSDLRGVTLIWSYLSPDNVF